MTFTLTLAVRDLDRTEVFYSDILHLSVERFTPAEGHPPVLILRRGDASLLFREYAVLEALHPALFQNLDRHPAGAGVSLEFTVSDLRPISQAIFRRNLHTLYEMEDDEFDRRELWLHDPDGYLVVLTQEQAASAQGRETKERKT